MPTTTRVVFNGAVLVSSPDGRPGDWRFATSARGRITLEVAPDAQWVVVAISGGL
jgi:hypothetical protein